MKQFRWLTALVVGAFLLAAGFVLANSHENTVAWTPGQGVDSEDCTLVGDGPRTEDGWLHFVLTGNNSGVTAARLELSGTGTGVYYPEEDLPTNGSLQFFTPYYELDGLVAIVYYTGTTSGQLVLSDYCPGDEKSIEVTKTADATWTREHFWDIDKRVETEKGDTVGDSIPKIWLDGPSTYEETATWYVDVNYGGFEDRDFVVSGTITIKNISASGASKEVFSITDDLGFPGYSDIEVVCPVTLPYMLPFGEELICTYEVDLTGEAEPGEFGTNRVDVVVTGDSNEYFDTDDWAFGLLPDEEINECVTITDTNPGFGDKYGPAVTVCVGFDVNEDGDSVEFSYEDTFAWVDYQEDFCGSGFSIENTAAIFETEQTAEAILKVNVRCEELTVSKTAFGEYEVFHAWEIEKFVKTDNGFFVEDVPKIWLYADGSGDETAYWTVKVTYMGAEDQNVFVYGEVTIENTGELDAVITDIEDLLDGNLIDLDCGDDFGLPFTLDVGETLTCDYREELDEQVEADNVVTVTTERDVYGVTEPIIWSEPIGIASSVTISDDSTFEGFGVVELGTLNAGDFEAGEYKLFEYEWDFAWADYPECGSFKYDNTATILDTEQDADASLKVNVQCVEDESAWAKGDPTLSFCDISTVGNWGWTNLVVVGESYTWPLYAGAAQCDPENGVEVGTVYVDWSSGYVEVTVDLFDGFTLLGDPHVYAGENRLPTVGRGRETTAPGEYTIDGPFTDGTEIYVIVHAVVLVPDPDFGP